MTISKRFLSILAPAAMLALVFSACDDNDSPSPSDTTPDGYAQVNANSYTDWVYFSFESGQIVTPADPSTSLEWDIAFHLWDVRTNSGASGPGQGGAYRATGDLTALLEQSVIPREGLFVVDGTIRTFMSNPMQGGPRAFDPSMLERLKVEVSGNTALAAWISAGLNTMPPPAPVFEPSVWWIRTADGEYVLLQFIDHLTDAPNPTLGGFEFWPAFNYWLK